MSILTWGAEKEGIPGIKTWFSKDWVGEEDGALSGKFCKLFNIMSTTFSKPKQSCGKRSFFMLVLPFHTFLWRLALELASLPLLELGGPFAWGGGTLALCWRNQSSVVTHFDSPWVTDASLAGFLQSERKNKDPSSHKDHCLLGHHCELGKISSLIKKFGTRCWRVGEELPLRVTSVKVVTS
jgi:hypothetical protein